MTVDRAAIDSRKAPISRSIRRGASLLTASHPGGSPSDRSHGICMYQHGAARRNSGISVGPSDEASSRSTASSTGMYGSRCP
jgi:hypothetical protein